MNRVTNITWRTSSGIRLGGFAYRYDAVGRIVSRAHDLGGASFDRDYAYDDMDRLASDGGTAYAYDAAELRAVHDCGRALAFAYDDEGFLVSVVTDDSAVRVDYSYDDVSGAYPRTVLARAVRSDHAQASTNLYTWCPSPLAGLMNSPGSGIAGLQALSLKLGAGLDDLHFKTERAERALERGTTAEIIAATGDLRRTVDRLELLVDDGKWPLPKYRDMLFIY